MLVREKTVSTWLTGALLGLPQSPPLSGRQRTILEEKKKKKLSMTIKIELQNSGRKLVVVDVSEVGGQA